MHMKWTSLGLSPFGVRVEYYCPTKNREITLKSNFEDMCPLCNEYVRWREL